MKQSKTKRRAGAQARPASVSEYGASAPRDDQLQLAFDAAQIGWWNWDIVADRITWSDRPLDDAQQSYALDAFLAIVHPDDRERVRQTIIRVIEKGDRFEVELRLVPPGSGCRWYLAKGQVYYDSNLRPVCMAGVNIDVTERKAIEDAVRRSEAKAAAVASELATVMATVPAMIFIAKDPQCQFIGGNDSGLKALGLPRDANVARSPLDGHPAGDYRVLQNGRELAAEELPVQRAAATGQEVRDVELTLELEDGTCREIFGHAAPLFESSGEVRGAVGAFVDITARKVAERKFEELLQAAPDSIVIVDEAGQIVLVNKQAEIQFGYSRQEMLGQAVEMLIPERFRGRHQRHRAEYFNNPYTREMGVGFELHGRRKDGSEFPAEIRLGMLKTGKSILAASAIRDTSDRKRYEHEAADRLRQLEQLTDVAATILDVFEGTADQAMYATVLGSVLSSFDCKSGYFGRIDEEGALCGAYASANTQADARWAPHEWSPLWQEALAEKKVLRFNAPSRLTPALEVQRSLVAPILSQGMPVGLLHIADRRQDFNHHDQDLLDRVARLIGPVLSARIQRDREERDRKRAEAQLESYRAELAHALRLSSMGEMAAGIAHELNQPLSAISNFARGSMRRLNNGTINVAELTDAAQSIAEETARAAEIIRSLRRYAQKRLPQHDPTDINEIVYGAARIVAGQAHQRGVAIDVRCANNLPELEGDHTQLKQVIVNLLSNGLDALEPLSGDKSLSIETCCCETGEVEVAVSDNGVGLAAGEEQKIFDAFFTTKPEGLGMGLAISRSMIEAHGGRLWAEPNDRGGATFRFRLPLVP